ncbi:MAG: DUF3592 domain-containing protein [bacterium]
MRKISFFKILYHDYAAFGTFAAMGIGLFAVTGGLIFGDQTLWVMGSIFAGVAGILFMLRMSIIHNIINHWTEVEATVINKWYIRDRGRIEYQYQYQGESITSGWAIMINKVNRQVEKGMVVKVLINPDKPKQSLVLSFFEVK